ncbi:MAG: SUMF1/EgtB/PvdO family nonheme iron enzyme [Gammaproteobacteria bacterium]|nr:SUMF1/EgtB/PvdO family nonheme iron enzyme [Gammaproteobacteria bacterium]NIR23862.1 SUMF1/EgtB/PvdO family nonheme iron enzyme [Gammaproteobacteria bacterium]NIS05311.1 SUMF1/EgtB/PvdO family nonheme iron enzyme [Gammaproteobacteria bacterium]NIV47938.1 SUMF1/EgtB/PvdO family nonheme iron enzyme [Gammaproteobacteria bacterium]NIW02644.1 SUMF1/EgtB/PvdO family nonheme iron enzyme [Gammaproteobacteria bacterium]
MDQLPRKLAAILYADVAGYSRLTGEDEEGTHLNLRQALELFAETIDKHHGRVVHYAGDAVLADFPTVTDALNCAVSVQEAVHELTADLPEDRRVKFRIGVNLGEVIVDREDIYGDGVNVAARLETLATPGGICISEAVRSAAGRKLSLTYEFLGAQRVKNITDPVRAYRVVPFDGIDAGDLSETERKYRERLHARYADDASYYVPLGGQTTDLASTKSAKAPRSASRRSRRAHFEYNEWIPVGEDIKQVKLDSLLEAIDKYPCIILLGDPGCGKSTTLEALAYEHAQDPDRLPLLLRLSEFAGDMSVEDFIAQSWGGSEEAGHWGAPELAANLEAYLQAGKLLFLFDALNEMSHDGYGQRATALRRFIDRWSARGNRFVVTCRILDYGEELSGLQRVEVQPLNDKQIEEFLRNELPEKWQALWQTLRNDDRQHRLLEMARNPYLLTVMIDVFEEDSELSQNRSDLMRRFTHIMLEWAKAKSPPDQWLDADLQFEALSVMAFEMQARSGFGTKVKTEQVKAVMPHELQPDPKWPAQPISASQVLSLAANAHIVEMPVDRLTVRFYHQLLQEYFAAHHMLKKDPAALSHLWRGPWLESEMVPWIRPENNYEPLPPPPPTGWEETTILAFGSAPENDRRLIQTLVQINPVLAGRCLLQNDNAIDSGLHQAVVDKLLGAIADPEVSLRVRIAAGNVLGFLGDPRLGEMMIVPAGSFLMGQGSEQHKLSLPDFQIGRYPVTNAEFQRFIDAGGYENKRWWTEAGWREVGEEQSEPRFWQDARFDRPNQPALGLSWYECVAYCRWLSAETGQLHRLPTEAEWEKAARGVDGRTYPWSNEFEIDRLNSRAGANQVCSPTPVGIYPTGVSPFGLFDCVGNVWEWCATRWRKPYPYDTEHGEWQDDYLEGQNLRVLRGGSWYCERDFTRCTYRFKFQPYGWNDRGACRIVCNA